MVTPSLRCYSSSRPLSQQPNNYIFSNHSLSSFRFSPTARFSEIFRSVWDPEVSWGFFPFSAVIVITCEQDSRLTAARSQVFSTSQQVFYVIADLQVYSTLLALLGSSLQSIPVKRSIIVIQLPYSFTVTCLARFPFRNNLRSHAFCHWGFPCQRLDSCGPLAFLQKPASVLDLGRS